MIKAVMEESQEQRARVELVVQGKEVEGDKEETKEKGVAEDTKTLVDAQQLPVLDLDMEADPSLQTPERRQKVQRENSLGARRVEEMIVDSPVKPLKIHSTCLGGSMQ